MVGWISQVAPSSHRHPPYHPTPTDNQKNAHTHREDERVGHRLKLEELVEGARRLVHVDDHKGHGRELLVGGPARVAEGVGHGGVHQELAQGAVIWGCGWLFTVGKHHACYLSGAWIHQSIDRSVDRAEASTC